MVCLTEIHATRDMNKNKESKIKDSGMVRYEFNISEIRAVLIFIRKATGHGI